MIGPNVLIIPDLHIPYEHPDALLFVQAVRKQWFGADPIMVCLGDEIDSHSISRHMPDPNGRSPGDELEEAKHKLRDWFTAFPVMRVCTSNHTLRPWKRAYEVGLPKQFMRDVGEVLRAPQTWLWADRWVIAGVCFEHGENVSGPTGALKAAQQNRMPTVIGHLHSGAGVIHSDAFTGKLYGMNAGCLIDVDALAFAYAKNIRNKPCLGVGVIKNGSPYFVPMILSEQGRWAGAI